MSFYLIPLILQILIWNILQKSEAEINMNKIMAFSLTNNRSKIIPQNKNFKLLSQSQNKNEFLHIIKNIS